ncbi:MAG: hypothetical protein AAF587_41845 [Bacteroidota bacterium]
MTKRPFTFTSLLLLGLLQQAWACDLCKRKQPDGLENITHGIGPAGMLDYVISYSAVALVLIVLILSIKYLIRPGETHPMHIKHIVLYEQS